MSQNLFLFLHKLINSGLKIDTVYDIGAHHGLFSKSLKKTLPNIDIIMFEANSAHNKQLSDTGFKFFNAILSNPSREFVDFYDGTSTGDSYYKENTTHYDNKTPVKTECTTLDNLVNLNNLPIPNFIKLDTQGSEIDILSGASFLEKVDLLYLECPIMQYNIGAPTFNDYLDFLKKQNFVPVDIFEIHKQENLLMHIDIMFMKHETKEKYLGNDITMRPLYNEKVDE
jgi:FkbM family methyltransferase